VPSVKSLARRCANLALAIGLAAPFAAAAVLAGCGGSSGSGALNIQRTSDPIRHTTAPPVSDLQLTTGSPAHQITETLISFYRAAWEDDAATACSLFSPAGAAGFIDASKTAFPGSATPASPCTHDMQLFAAALGDSVSNLQQTQPSISGNVLDNISVAKIQIHGDTATAEAPMNVVAIINPKRIDLVQIGGRWRINASHSLNQSNLPKLLKHAQQTGKLSKR
jgi:hypothetical protein